MLLSPEMSRAARALLRWDAEELAAAAGLSASTVKRFERGGMVRAPSVEAMLHALEGAGLEFIAAGGRSLDGGPGLRTMPMLEPEVAAAEEAVELDETARALDESEAQDTLIEPER